MLRIRVVVFVPAWVKRLLLASHNKFQQLRRCGLKRCTFAKGFHKAFRFSKLAE